MYDINKLAALSVSHEIPVVPELTGETIRVHVKSGRFEFSDEFAVAHGLHETHGFDLMVSAHEILSDNNITEGVPEKNYTHMLKVPMKSSPRPNFGSYSALRRKEDNATEFTTYTVEQLVNSDRYELAKVPNKKAVQYLLDIYKEQVGLALCFDITLTESATLAAASTYVFAHKTTRVTRKEAVAYTISISNIIEDPKLVAEQALETTETSNGEVVATTDDNPVVVTSNEEPTPEAETPVPFDGGTPLEEDTQIHPETEAPAEEEEETGLPSVVATEEDDEDDDEWA